MKTCPICERKYDDEMRICGIDGTPLVGSDRGTARQDPVIGRTIKGRYHVLRKLGQGGMGAVYLAEQMSIGRKVALKLMRTDGAAEEEFVARFRREARLAAALNHRNIVMTYDFDQDDDGTLFIAMEYLNGSNLAQIIRRDGPLSISRATSFALQLAEGLDAAHQAGVIHRDIKPDNIMVVEAAGSEVVKLMDFGIARLRDAANASRLTRADVMMGTPAYMAPEQAQGADASEKTDIYALGVVVYEMLTGSVPFQASTPSAVLLKHIQEAPLPPRNLRQEIPASVESVVMQALEKAPEDRQPDMRAVAAGFKRSGVGDTQAVATLAETLVLPSNRRGASFGRFGFPLKTVGIGVAALVLVSIIGFGAWKILTAPDATPAKPPSAQVDAPPLAAPAPVSVTPPSHTKNEAPGPPVFADRNEPPIEIQEPPPAKSVKPPLFPQSASADKPLPPLAVVPPAKSRSERLESRANAEKRSGSKEFTGSGTQTARTSQPALPAATKAAPTKSPPAQSAATPPRPSYGSPAPSGDVAPPPAQSYAPPEAPSELSAPKPVTSQPPAPAVAKPREPAPPKIDVREHLRVADSLRARGQYAAARVELEKARAAEPSNKEIQAALERVARACEAERKILRQPDLKC